MGPEMLHFNNFPGDADAAHLCGTHFSHRWSAFFPLHGGVDILPTYARLSGGQRSPDPCNEWPPIGLQSYSWPLGPHLPLGLACTCVSRQTSPSIGFSRQEYRVGCHFLLLVIFLTRDRTWVSCIAGRFFTIWATREALMVSISPTKPMI